MELGSNEAIKQAVVGGLGIAVLSKNAIEQEGSEGGLVILDAEGFPIIRHWHLIFLKKKQLSVIARSFAEFLYREQGERCAFPDVVSGKL